MEPKRTHSKNLILAVHHFPDCDTLIRAEYVANEAFRRLCDDLRLCSEALRRWQKSESAIAEARANEYAQSLVELREEMAHWLREQQTTGP